MCVYSNLAKYPDKDSAMSAYLTYLDTHDTLVKDTFNKFGKAFADELDVDFENLKDLISKHDISKRDNKLEIDGFIANFYPYEGDGIGLDEYGIRRAIYEKGLLHHYNANPHHPEYWVFFRTQDNRMDCKPMEKIYVCEMVIDWIANERNDNLSVQDFWTHNKGSKFIHEDTIKLVDRLIKVVNTIRSNEE